MRELLLGLLHVAIIAPTIVALNATAAVIHVPAGQPTIQGAIDAAQNGDTIVVAPGVYNEALDTLSKSIQLRSAAGPTRTVLDGIGLNTSILVCSSHGPLGLVVIEGFTFTRGEGSLTGGGGRYGGAIATSYNGHPMIIDCVFVDNMLNAPAPSNGGAIAGGPLTAIDCTFVNNGFGSVALSSGLSTLRRCIFRNNPHRAAFIGACSPTFDDCVFEDNSCDTDDGGAVAVIPVDFSISPTFIGCTFRRNRAGTPENPRDGGAIHIAVYGSVMLTLSHCTFNSNTASEGGAVFNLGGHGRATDCNFQRNVANIGGALANLDYQARVQWCRFDDNHANAGGALATSFGSVEATIAHCQFRDNTATFGGAIQADGGSIDLINCLFDRNSAQNSGGAVSTDADTLRITNCTFARDRAEQQWKFGNGGALATSGFATIAAANCILWDNHPDQVHVENGSNVTMDFSLIQGGWNGPGQGNIDDDPLFADIAAGNLRLSRASPCVDTGDNAAAAALKINFDIDQRPRVVDGDADALAIVDMGAFEFAAGCPADIVFTGPSAQVVDADDLLAVILVWGPCPAPPDVCAADVNNSGTVDADDLVEVVLAWGPCP
jgi:predicted outer membrane repeat protein